MPLSIWMVAAEVSPLAETGGLGEVLRALPSALARRGARARRFLPAYASIDRQGFEPDGPAFALALGPDSVSVRLWSRADAPGLTTTLVEHDPAFGRAGIYGDREGDYPDNARRFALLCRAVCAAAQRAAEPPQILHAHDWPAGAVPLLARLGRAGTPRPCTLFTIHNLSYQGLFEPAALRWLGLSDDEGAQVYQPFDGVEFYGQLSFMKAALVYADRITTVSPTHAREIQTPAFGAGLDGLLRRRAADLSGVLNGADYDSWNPARDPALRKRYDATTVAAGKRAAASALRRTLALPRSKRPIVGLLGRLVPQKGVDLVIEAIPSLLELGVDLVVLGDGLPELAARLERARAQHPRRVGLRLGYDRALARVLLAGSELMLMPSRYEPCGLTQIYAMRYGSIPVAHATGGLCDTIRDADRSSDGTGFLFETATAAELARGVERALQWRANAELWDALRQRAMREDFSWQRAAQAYEQLYALLLPEPR